MSTQGEDKITLYRSLFRGRDDIFARRWEKDGKSGYPPAYSFDWNEFNAHRSRGGTLKNFENGSRKGPVFSLRTTCDKGVAVAGLSADAVGGPNLQNWHG